MNKFLFIPLFFVSFLGYGQDLKLTSDSDTLFWNIIQNEKMDFNLSELEDKSDFVFRCWYPGRLLEIKNDNDTIRGTVTYFVYEIWEENYKADTFVKTYILDNLISINLYYYILNSGIQDIPSDKHIEGWRKGFDGKTHIYELKKNNEYSFKSYWTPSAQNEIKEAEFIIDFNQNIEEIAELNKFWKDFNESIPFISYKNPGSASATLKVLTKKETRRYKNERKKRVKKTRDNSF